MCRMLVSSLFKCEKLRSVIPFQAEQAGCLTCDPAMQLRKVPLIEEGWDVMSVGRLACLLLILEDQHKPLSGTSFAVV